MNKNAINYYLKNINLLSSEIINKEQTIENLKAINNQKRRRNEESFRNIMDTITAKENNIKTLMDNKDFSYIQFIDFINDNNIHELSGFQINDNGALVEEPKNIIPNKPIDKSFNLDKTEIIYTFNEGIISNNIEYSFYNMNGVPIIPQDVIIKYEEFEDTFYEPFFRYYNRYISNTFINSFLFTPKKIKSIKFIFSDSINTSNDYCSLFTYEYETRENAHYALLYFENPYNLQNFNIFKNANDAISTKFEFTEDNITYKEITFENNEAVFNLEKRSRFFIRITSDYSTYNPVENKKSVNTMFNYELTDNVEESYYSFDIPGNINNIDVIVPFSTYSKIAEEMKKINLNINDFIEKSNDLYMVKKDFIKYIAADEQEISKLRFFDDISILKENKKYFNFYVNTSKNEVYFSSFINRYKFSYSVDYNTVKEQIDAKYFTPMIFDISIKG